MACATDSPAISATTWSIATRHTDQIEARAILKRVRGYETEPTVAGHRSRRFCHDVHRGLGEARQHLLRAGEVELR